MARVCKNCGTKNSFGSRYCEECGQKLESSIDIANIKKPIKASRKMIISLVLLVISVVLLTLVFSSFGSMDNVLDKYFRGLQKNVISDFIEAFPPQISKSFTASVTVGDISYDEFLRSFDKQYADFYSVYGQRFRIRYTVSIKEHWAIEEVSKAKDQLFDMWRIPKASVKDIITVILQVTVKGEGQQQNATVSIDMVKIRGKWFVYPDYDAFMNPIK